MPCEHLPQLLSWPVMVRVNPGISLQGRCSRYPSPPEWLVASSGLRVCLEPEVWVSLGLTGPALCRFWTSRKQYNPIESIMTLIPKPIVNSWPGPGSSLFAFNIIFSAAEVKHALLCLPTLSAQGRNLFQTVPVHVCLTACESLEVITTEWCSWYIERGSLLA